MSSWAGWPDARRRAVGDGRGAALLAARQVFELLFEAEEEVEGGEGGEALDIGRRKLRKNRMLSEKGGVRREE